MFMNGRFRGGIPRWMGERHQNADHILCVISNAYLKAPYSSWERQAAERAAASTRPNFALPVKVEECELPTLSMVLEYCDLFGSEETEARTRLRDYLAPAGKPPGSVLFSRYRQSQRRTFRKLRSRSPVVPARLPISRSLFPGISSGVRRSWSRSGAPSPTTRVASPSRRSMECVALARPRWRRPMPSGTVATTAPWLLSPAT